MLHITTRIAVLLLITVGNVFGIGLDGSFATGGKFMTGFADTGNPTASAARVFVQPSGRIVVVGSHTQDGIVAPRVFGVAIVGLTSSGTLDSGFGTAGKILTWSATEDVRLVDAAMLADGSFLVLSWSGTPRLVKYTANGQLDGTFTADLAVPTATGVLRPSLGANGKIYVVVQLGLQHSIVRLHSNGSRDETFGPNGMRPLNLGRIRATQRSIGSILEVEGGKILVTGNHEAASQWEIVGFVARFDSEMNLDRSFGRQGIVQINIPGGYTIGITRAIVLPNGKYLLAGYYTFLGSYALLVQLTSRGRYDASFGNSGVSLTSVEDINAIYGVTVDPNGKIVVAGSTSDKTFPTVQQLWIARFGTNGLRESLLATSFISGLNSSGSDVTIQPDGKMIAVGSSQFATNSNYQFAVARYVP